MLVSRREVSEKYSVRKMVVRREKKSRSLRGWRTHGWGRVGQHRRSGGRGGRGHAGMHKHMWSWIVKYAPDWFGKHGFTRPPALVKESKIINLAQLDEKIPEWVESGIISKEGDTYLIDVVKLGYNKVTGSGRITKKIKLYTLSITEKARKKIEEIGGEVILLKS